MSNKIIMSIVKEKLDSFCNAFSNAKNIFLDKEQNKIIHPGELGVYRECIVRNMLELFIPQRYKIGQGFLLSNTDEVSTQCDVIIYDSNSTPLIQNDYDQRFYPIESVVGVGEVKSVINSKSELNICLNKLAKIKMLRDKTDAPDPFYRQFKRFYDPKNNPFDQIFSFVICKNFNFHVGSEEIIKYEENILQHYWHNIIISIDDGIFSYKTKAGSKNVYFPYKDDDLFEHYWLVKDENDISSHIILFLSALHSAIKLTTILNIDLALYLTNNVNRKIR